MTLVRNGAIGPTPAGAGGRIGPLPRARPASSNAVALAAIAAVAAATAAVSLTAVNHVKDAAIAASLHGQPLRASTLAAALTPADALPATLALAAFLALAWLEWRRGAVTCLLRTATDTEAFLLLTVLVAWFGHAYLNPGVLLGGDTGSHIARFLEVQRGLQSGRLALWTNYQYAGAPLLWFTGPLTYVVGGALSYALNDPLLAAKILLFSLHMLAGWLFYAWMRRLGIRPVPAMFAAVCFAGSFAHLHLFLYRGVMPQAFTIVTLVLLFYAADGLLRERGARWANFLIFSLSTAAMIVNHQPHALFAAIYLAAFGAVLLLSGVWRWRGVPVFVLAGLLGALASTVAVAPVLSEGDWVMIEPGEPMFRFRLPAPARLLNLLTWHNSWSSYGADYWTYLGVGVVVFAAFGIAALLRGRLTPERRATAAASCLCLAIGLVMYNPVVRDVLFLLFFFCVLGGMGLDWLLDRPALAGPRLLVLAVLVLADLAITSVQPVARTDKDFMIDAGRFLERTAPDRRVVQVTVDAAGRFNADKTPGSGPLSYYSTVQRIAGNHNMAATRVHNFLAAAANLVETDLQTAGALSAPTRSLLQLFNVGEVICNSSIANGCPASVNGTADNTVLGRYIPIEGTPAVFSQRLTPLDLDANLEKPMFWPEDFAPDSQRRPRVDAVDGALDRFLAIEQLQPGSLTVPAIAIRDAPAAAPPPNAAPWQPAIQDYAVTLDRVRLQVTANAPGYVQLAHPWFPSTSITVNGAAATPIRGAIDLIVLPLGAGTSVIELQDSFTPARRASAVASLLGLLAIAAATLLLSRRRAPGLAAEPG